MRSASLVIAASMALLGCSDALPPDVACPDVLANGVRVAITDSLTGAPTAAGATVTATDGSFVDTRTVAVDAAQTTIVGLALGRAGTYTITAQKDGYATWTKSNVVAAKGVCGVESVLVTAKLRGS